MRARAGRCVLSGQPRGAWNWSEQLVLMAIWALGVHHPYFHRQTHPPSASFTLKMAAVMYVETLTTHDAANLLKLNPHFLSYVYLFHYILNVFIKNY
jgi:hypothetical protein